MFVHKIMGTVVFPLWQVFYKKISMNNSHLELYSNFSEKMYICIFFIKIYILDKPWKNRELKPRKNISVMECFSDFLISGRICFRVKCDTDFNFCHVPERFHIFWGESGGTSTKLMWKLRRRFLLVRLLEFWKKIRKINQYTL